MRIETERLILREFREADWPDILAYWRDPLYRRYNPDPEDVEQTVSHLVDTFVSSQAEQPRRHWQLAIVDREDGRLLGNCGIRVDNAALRQANIGYELDPRAWGRGYATEAARSILDFGFAELGMCRVWAECVADNVRSARVLERLGMRREAHFREHKHDNGRWWDTLIYAILEREWRAGRDQPGSSD